MLGDGGVLRSARNAWSTRNERRLFGVPLEGATGGLGTVVPADGPPTSWVARSRSFINSWFMLSAVGRCSSATIWPSANTIARSA